MERVIKGYKIVKVLMINSVCGVGSTGRICTDIAEMLEERGDTCKIIYGRNSVPVKYEKYAIKIGGKLSVSLHAFNTRVFDCAGFGSKIATRKIIKAIKAYDPDIIHLHNLHGYYINVKILFDYLKKSNKTVFWSFYDCWAFTGHCAHFDYNGCDGWEKECKKCKFKKEYPKSLIFSRAHKNYSVKKKIFSDLKNLHIIAPSRWMEGLVKKSFFHAYPIHLLPNGIDLKTFHKNNLIDKSKIDAENKFVVLGVSNVLSKMKGIEEFNYLADNLPKDKFKFVLIGALPKSINISGDILHIQRTNDIEELCGYYSVADVFVNPTYQETQGLTTIEAMACGTPVVVYNSGGAAECVTDKCGIIVERGDVEGLKEAVIKITENPTCFDKTQLLKQAEKYEKVKLYEDFMALYADSIIL